MAYQRIKMTPIIPWPGGKRRLAKHILPLLKDHECYVEAFCGGAAIFFMRQEPAKCEVLNDVNRDVVNLYRVVQHHLDEFVRQFRWSLTSREMFKWCQLQHTEPLTDIQRAARFFYLQSNSFGGKVSKQNFGTVTTGYHGINLLRLEETLSFAHLRLSRVLIECLPWAQCVNRYDRPHTLFFLDPPYWQTEGYGVEFGWPEYEHLNQLMRSVKGQVVLTINDHPDIAKLFKGLPMQKVGIKYSIGLHGKSVEKSELIITNK